MPKKLFDPDGETIIDLIAEGDLPTQEQIEVGKMALDEYYNGTKDAPEDGSFAYVYRAMTGLKKRAHEVADPAPFDLNGLKYRVR